MNLSLIEQLSYSTIRIEAELSDGTTSTGTGFFYAIDVSKDDHIPLIITNKHVVRDTRLGKFLFTLRNGAGKPDNTNHYKFTVSDFEDAWTHHPDPDVDLCAMPMAELRNLTLDTSGKEPFYLPFNSSMIPSQSDIEELIGNEDVQMIGYPNGLWDEINNFPLFRKGALASHFKYDWNGKKEFIVDISVFPGSSGSPIFLADVQGYRTKKGMYMNSTRFKLLGIVYAVFLHNVKGDVQIIDIPANQKAISSSLIPNNLGIAIKSQRLLDFDDIFKQKLKGWKCHL